jgi:hypothetical protein
MYTTGERQDRFKVVDVDRDEEMVVDVGTIANEGGVGDHK